MTDHPLLSWLGNLTSLVAIVATLGGWIPVFAAVIAIAWYVVQLYESAYISEMACPALLSKNADCQEPRSLPCKPQ